MVWEYPILLHSQRIYMQFLWMNGYVPSMFLQLLIKKKKKNIKPFIHFIFILSTADLYYPISATSCLYMLSLALAALCSALAS